MKLGDQIGPTFSRLSFWVMNGYSCSQNWEDTYKVLWKDSTPKNIKFAKNMENRIQTTDVEIDKKKRPYAFRSLFYSI